MPGFLRKWMVLRSPEQGDALTTPNASWRTSRSGGAYASELRDLSRRLVEEAPLDLRTPDQALRGRTLNAIREAHFGMRRRGQRWWSLQDALSPRLVRTLATCVLLAIAASVTIHEGGPELFDAIGAQFSKSSVRVDHAAARSESSDSIGLPIDDELDAIAQDTRDAARRMLSPITGDGRPEHADVNSNRP